jgi:membrane protease YdiL (CAAX protease family)
VNTPEESAPQEPGSSDPAIVSETSIAPSNNIDPDNPPWGLVHAILIAVASVILLIVMQGIATVIYLATHSSATPLTQDVLLNDKTYIVMAVASILPAHLLTIGIAWAVASRLGRFSPIQTLGFGWPENFGLWKSIGLAIILIVVAMGMLYAFGGADTQLDRILRSSRAAALVMALLATVTAPLMEEVVYRGLLYSALQRWTGAMGAVALVTLIFAGLHVWQYWPNFGAISAILLLSLALTLVRARTGRLLPCYVIHLVFNGVQAVIIVAEPYLRTVIETPQPEAAPAVIHFVTRFL